VGRWTDWPIWAIIKSRAGEDDPRMSGNAGLGRYEATFRESEIDADVLPDLTDGDLEKLGMPWGTVSTFSRQSQVWARR
jgi:hypothetical protein